MIPIASGRAEEADRKESAGLTVIVGMLKLPTSCAALERGGAMSGELLGGGLTGEAVMSSVLSLDEIEDNPGRRDHQCVRPVRGAACNTLRRLY